MMTTLTLKLLSAAPVFAPDFGIYSHRIGEQWLVAENGRPLGEARRVRALSLPPQSSFCQVDDATQQLVVNEENVGWWAYPAHPEADVKRTPVAVFDMPKREAGAMALVPGGLLALDPEAGALHLYGRDGGTWRSHAYHQSI